MQRTIVLAGVLPFVSAFLGGVLAFSLMAAPPATAQSSQLQEVRASGFTLVAPDGTVVGRLHVSSLSGVGLLSLYDPDGVRHLEMAGWGVMNAYDDDGQLAYRAGRSAAASPPITPPVNGVLLGPGGSIGALAY